MRYAALARVLTARLLGESSPLEAWDRQSDAADRWAGAGAPGAMAWCPPCTHA